MSLVDYDILPTEFSKGRFLSHTHFIRCDEDIEFLSEDNIGNDACLWSQTQSCECYGRLTRSSLVPWSTVVLNPGTHFSTSLAQLFNVDLGTTIKWGPAVPWWNLRYPKNEIVWSVLHKPYQVNTPPINFWGDSPSHQREYHWYHYDVTRSSSSDPGLGNPSSFPPWRLPVRWCFATSKETYKVHSLQRRMAPPHPPCSHSTTLHPPLFRIYDVGCRCSSAFMNYP